MIRPLRIEDIPALMEFFFDDRNFQQDKRFDFESEDFKQMMEYSHIHQLVWEENSKIIAYLAGYNMGVWGYIDVLIVKSSDRNKGIGKSLIQHFISIYPQWVRLETSCYADDLKSINFVRNNGFDIEQTLAWFGKEI